MNISKENNLDFIRFLSASLVIISHSSLITNNGVDFLEKISRGQESIGGLSVSVFFIISGYLITSSYRKNNNFFKFILARCLRIFPALIPLFCLTVFIVGPLFTQLSLHEYFNSSISYFKNILLYPLLSPNTLPGVIFSSSRVPDIVNGSLWTLAYEFFCYILIAVLGAIRLLRKEFMCIIFLVLIFCFSLGFNSVHKILPVLPIVSGDFQHVLRMIICFVSGSIFYFYENKLVYSWKYLITIMLLLLTSILTKGFIALFMCTGVYLVFYIAESKKIRLYNFAKYGDFSYGIYIYGFLIQQVIIRIFDGNMSSTLNYMISLPITFLCAFLSWHIIEKRALNFKTRLYADIF